MQVLRQNPAIQGLPPSGHCAAPRVRLGFAAGALHLPKGASLLGEDGGQEQGRRGSQGGRRSRLLGDSGMGARFQNRTFDRFQVTPENQKAYTACKEYAAAFKAQMLPGKGEDGEAVPPQRERNGLFLVGGYGTGKTHLAAAVANELIRNGTPALCMTMIDLLANVRRTYNGQGDEADILKLYTETPLLIIDDLGSEAATEWTSSMIFTIVNARYEAYMPVIVTTNCGTEELTRSLTPAGCSERNAQKMIDRLREMCLAVPLDGPSWRAK